MFHVMHDGSDVAGKDFQAADKSAAHQASTIECAVHGVQDVCCMRPAPKLGRGHSVAALGDRVLPLLQGPL